MRAVVFFVAPLIVLMSATETMAARFIPSLTVGVADGTLGVQPELRYANRPFLAVRTTATFLGVHGHGGMDASHYTGPADLGHFGAAIDLHPFLNRFRISVGARSTACDHVSVTGVPRSSQPYGTVTVSPQDAATLTGTLHPRSVSPLATVGFVRQRVSGLTLGVDGGVLFHGRPSIDEFLTTGELGSNPFALTDLLHREARLNETVREYRYYPILQVSLGYRF